jgi:tetratricopeptide (TPR) repeat protein
MRTSRPFPSWAGAALALSVYLLACGPSFPPAYDASTASARQAYERGQYAMAAQHWAEAARVAPNTREQDECRYRQAVSLQRAGLELQARSILRALGQRSTGQRAARARFDHASSLIRSGKEVDGFAELRRAVLQFPDSGLAPKATRQLLERERERSGAQAALVLLAELERSTGESDLNQVLLYERAKLTEEAAGAAAALRAYRALIVRHPYPGGSYWDEAILRAAELERGLGRPQRAIEWLQFLLGHREQSNFMGSYERHYSKAQWLLAEIARDDLEDWQRARSEFQVVFEDYPTSLLGDDALFEAARLSHAHGQDAQACNDVRRLQQEFPDSRHIESARALCSNTPK